MTVNANQSNFDHKDANSEIIPSISPTSLLKVLESSPKEIMNEFKELNITIKEFIQNLPPISQKNITKLLLLIENIEDIIPLTREHDRNTRFISTVICLLKIKILLMKKSKDHDLIFTLFDEVFILRYKDVDANIRMICVENLTEYIYLNDIFRTKEYGKYLGWALEDKNDGVKKKAIKGCLKILEIIKCDTKTKNKLNEKTNKELIEIFKIYKNKVILLCEGNKSGRIKQLSVTLLMKMYKQSLCDKEELFKVINNFSEKEINSLFEDIKKENGLFSAVKEIYEYGHEIICKINLNENEIKEIIKIFLEKEDIDFLSILALIVKPEHNVINELTSIIKQFKENKDNLILIYQPLITIDTQFILMEHEELVDLTIFIISNYNDITLLSRAFMFLKKVESIFSSKIVFFLENIKYSENRELILHALRTFDLSECITDDYDIESKILSSFWNMTKGNYFYLENVNLEIKNESDFEVATNFILYCFENLKQQSALDEKFEFCYDALSGMKFLFDRLVKECNIFLNTNLSSGETKSIEQENKEAFNFKEELKLLKNKKQKYSDKILTCFSKIAHFLADHLIILFYCKKDDILTAFNNFKTFDELTDAFFEYLKIEHNLNFGDIKNISIFLSKKLKKYNVYAFLKGLNEKKVLYDNCFVFFVKFLDVQECLKLYENIKFKGKYGKMLEKRCKGIKDDFTLSEEDKEIFRL